MVVFYTHQQKNSNLNILTVTKESRKSSTSSRTGESEDSKLNPKTTSPDNQPTKIGQNWTTTVPDLDLRWHDSKTPNYKRAFGIVERKIALHKAANDKINPRTPGGINQLREVVGIQDGASQLRINRSYPLDAQGVTTTRLGVVFNGIPVFGSVIILNQRQGADGLSEEIVKDVIQEAPKNLPTKPQLSVESAFERAQQDAQESSSVSDLDVQLLSSRLSYFPGTEKINLAWQVKVKTENYIKNNKQEPVGKWNYFVDAMTGDVLSKANEVQTELNSTETLFQGSGPGGNEGEGNNRSWNKELDVINNAQKKRYEMNTSNLVTIDLKGSEASDSWQTLLKKGFEVQSSSDLNKFTVRPANNAHGFGELTLKMLSKNFGYNSIDENGFKLPSLVNYSKSYDNAFWDGDKMTYGGGGSVFYDLASDIGVVAHEINHGFTQYHSGLAYYQESGGLNESFSDIAAVTTDFFANSSGASFLIGAKVVKKDGWYGDLGFLRNMCDPTRDGASIDKYSDYRDRLDVHYSSGIMNKVFCRFSKRLSTNGDPGGLANREGVLRAAKIFYDANKTKWGPLSTFRSAASGTIRSATNLGYSDAEIQFLKLSWEEVEVDSTPVSVNLTLKNMKNGSVSTFGSKREFTCDSPQTTCNLMVEGGEEVEMEFLANPGFFVSDIEGCDSKNISENLNYCKVRVGADRAISPSFTIKPAPPGAPTAVTANASAEKVFLSWNAPVGNGSAPIIDYSIQSSSNGGQTWTLHFRPPSPSTTATLFGLVNGTKYVFRVAAINNGGMGSYSDPSEGVVIPLGRPGIVRNLSGTVGNGKVTLAWDAPENNGGSAITDYRILYMAPGSGPLTVFNDGVSTKRSATVTGLTNGKLHFFGVSAVNAIGEGDIFFIASTPLGPPSAPSELVVTPARGQVALFWNAPMNSGGKVISDYAIQYSSNNGSSWITYNDGVSTSTNATVAALKDGTRYLFRVAAINSLGTGDYSNPMAGVTPVVPPSSPRGLNAHSLYSIVILTWLSPLSDGGSKITDYKVQYSSNNGVTWTAYDDGISTVPIALVKGLTRGTTYVFRVIPVNAKGEGDYSTQVLYRVP